MKLLLTQERIVLLLAAALFALFSITLKGFLTAENLLTLLRTVSVLGILGIGMVVVVIGGGIDLSLVANMAISLAWTFNLANSGVPIGLALLAGLAFVIVMGLISGIFVAYAEIPPLFATLAMGTFIYGFGRFTLVTQDVIFLPPNIGAVARVGQGVIAGHREGPTARRTESSRHVRATELPALGEARDISCFRTTLQRANG